MVHDEEIVAQYIRHSDIAEGGKHNNHRYVEGQTSIHLRNRVPQIFKII